MGKFLSNRQRYLESLANELHAESNRVRDLIGDAHWLSDGHQKEYVLLELLRRHLPFGMIAARGFVVSPSQSELRSREQDVMIVDSLSEAPVFHQGGLLISFPRSVRAAISVKTTLDSDSVADSINSLASVRNVACGHSEARSIWCGAFSFQVDATIEKNPRLVYGYVRRGMERFPIDQPSVPGDHPVPLGPDVVCSARNLVFKLDHGYRSDDNVTMKSSVRGFACDGLATAVFLGDLLDHIAVGRGEAGTDFSRIAEFDGVVVLDEVEFPGIPVKT